MIDGCYEYMTSLYIKSVIPVVIFSDEMDIIWCNKSFSEYFPYRSIENENMSALTKTQLKNKLSELPGFSGRFQITLSSEKKLSSSIVLLIFPADICEKKPKTFIGYIDDLTQDRNFMLRKTYLGLLEASKLKDDDTGNHIKRVGAYARRLSEECYKLKMYPQINPDFIETIHFLAPMHDVGKIGTPDEILTKRGPLDELQWAIMKEHTINGALILSNYPDIMAPEIARAHHEKWDGTGYLFGLAGEDIPLAARITAISDVYDALRMKRSYKEAFSHEKSIEIIANDSGTHFDPSLIEVFMSINTAFDNIFNAMSDNFSKIEGETIEDLPIYIEEEVNELEGLENFEELEELEEL